MFEALWWIFTFLLVLVILFPLYNEVLDYPFYTINTIAIISFITTTRYIFFLKHTPIADWQIGKAVIIIACIPLVFNLVNNINYFQTYLDEQGILSIMGDLHPSRIDALDRYMRNQMILFGVGGVISSVILPIRLIISVWRLRNKGTI